MVVKKGSKKDEAEVQAEMPDFNLNSGNLDFSNEEEFQEELEKGGGKYFDDPGNVDLEIVEADFHKNKDTGSIWCKGDETWFNVALTLQGPGEKQIKHWLQVPTSKLKYGEKDTLAVYKKYQQFLFALGEEVTLKSLQAITQKWFADPSKLVGQKLNADLGFEGSYIGKAEDDESFTLVVRGKPLKEDDEVVTFPDRASAKKYAEGKGIETGFIKILKFTAKKSGGKPAAKGAKAAPKKAADDSW